MTILPVEKNMKLSTGMMPMSLYGNSYIKYNILNNKYQILNTKYKIQNIEYQLPNTKYQIHKYSKNTCTEKLKILKIHVQKLKWSKIPVWRLKRQVENHKANCSILDTRKLYEISTSTYLQFYEPQIFVVRTCMAVSNDMAITWALDCLRKNYSFTNTDNA